MHCGMVDRVALGGSQLLGAANSWGPLSSLGGRMIGLPHLVPGEGRRAKGLSGRARLESDGCDAEKLRS